MNMRRILVLVAFHLSTIASASDTMMCWIHRTTEKDRDFRVLYVDAPTIGKTGKSVLALNARSSDPFSAFALFGRKIERGREYIGLRLYVTPNAIEAESFLKTFGSTPHALAPIADTDETLENLPYKDVPSKTVHLEFEFAGVHQSVACRVCRIESSCPSEETHREMAKATKSRFHGQTKVERSF